VKAQHVAFGGAKGQPKPVAPVAEKGKK